MSLAPRNFGYEGIKASGSRFIKLGAPKGQSTPQGDEQEATQVIVDGGGRWLQEVSELIEGE
jgi:hypothetical protein